MGGQIEWKRSDTSCNWVEQTEWRSLELSCESVCRHLVLSSMCPATVQRARSESQFPQATDTSTVVLLLASRKTEHDGKHQVLKASAGWVARSHLSTRTTLDQCSATDPPWVVQQGKREYAHKDCERAAKTQ